MKSKWVKVALQVVLFIGLPTWLEFWVIPNMPLRSLHLSNFWTAMIYRGIDAVIWVGVIWWLKPKSLTRLSVRKDPKRLLIALGAGSAYVGGQIVWAPYGGNPWWAIVGGLVFALGIGLHEEIFSRGLIFGFFEQYGVWVASIVSSVHFGLMHFSNYVWGGYSFWYNVSQVLGAGAFGFMCCGLMIYSGTIWLPILVHGLSDFPMQLMGAVTYSKLTTGSPDWFATGLEVFLCVLFGWALLTRSDHREMRRMRDIGLRFGLVEG